MNTKFSPTRLLVTATFFAACLGAFTPNGSASIALAQAATNNADVEDVSRDWEIDTDDIAAARQAATYLAAVQRTSHEISLSDIAAAREAAAALSQFNVAGEPDFDWDDLVAGELGAADIEAARELAYYLRSAGRTNHEISIADISAARQAAAYLSAAILVSGELNADDIAAAREAAQALTRTNMAGLDFNQFSYQRTVSE